jgi:putative flippase GtrA
MDVDARVTRLVEALPVIGPWYRTPEGRKKVRYALVSVVAVPIGTIGVLVFNLVGAPAGVAAVLGNSCAAVPSYILNRYWAWGKNDKNRLFGEILPFWGLTLLGIGFSFVVGHEAGQMTRHNGITGAARLAILLAANIAGFGVLWVAKYVIFNKVLFVAASDSAHDVPHDAPHEAQPELG